LRAISRIRKKSLNCNMVQSLRTPSKPVGRSFSANACGRIASASALATPSGSCASGSKL
jgi:hypothetical protein